MFCLDYFRKYRIYAFVLQLKVAFECPFDPPQILLWCPFAFVHCGCCTCLEFIATQCSVYVVAGILMSTSKDSPVRYIISSLTLNAILELIFVQCPCNSFCDSVILTSYSFIHSFLISHARVNSLF